MPKIRNSGFETATARLKKDPQGKPYWLMIDRGVALGYRRNVMGPGTWSVRGTVGHDQWIKAIGKADDYEAANGRDVLGYYEALDQARAVARQRAGGEAGPAERPATLGEAIDAYKDDLAMRGGDAKNANRLRPHLPPVLLARPVMLLNPKELSEWRAGLIKKGMTKATINRTLNCIKAACELAKRLDPRITSDQAWKVGLGILPNANRARDVILDDDMVRKLVAAAYALEHSFGVLVETAAVTGARLSQIARIEVRDLQADKMILSVPKSDKGKKRGVKVHERVGVPITRKLAETLRREAAGREAGDLLVQREKINAWRRAPSWTSGGSHAQLPRFRTIAEQCGLDPRRYTFTALRHSSIVRHLLRNVPIRLVASNHDTSVSVIEHNYSRYISGHGQDLVRGALEAMEGTSNVVPMKRKA
jgi:integrase